MAATPVHPREALAAIPLADDDVAHLERAFTALGRAILNLSARRGGAGKAGELDRTSYFALVLLDDAGPMRVSDLAESMGLDVSTVSRTLGQLTDANLVEKARDSHDGRVHQIALSTEGRAVLGQACAAKRELLGLATEDWSSQDRTALAEQMQRLARSLHETGLQLPSRSALSPARLGGAFEHSESTKEAK